MLKAPPCGDCSLVELTAVFSCSLLSFHCTARFAYIKQTGVFPPHCLGKTFFFFFLFYCLLSRLTSDHYLRSCGNVTCSRPQQKAPRLRIEPATSGTGVNHSTPAPVRSTLVKALLISWAISRPSQVVCVCVGGGGGDMLTND